MNALSPRTTENGVAGKGAFGRALFRLGITGEDPGVASQVGAEAFSWIRIVFGTVLLFDAWTSLTWVHKVAMSQALGLPTSSPVLHLVVIALAFLMLAIAVSILSGRGVIPMSWAGVTYAAFVWIVVQHGGDFGKDGTDPGVALPYVVMFLYLIGVARLREGRTIARNEMLSFARISFGMLWAYDALMKLHPYFLNNFADFLSSAQKDTAGTWVAGYDHLFLLVTNGVGPHLVAVVIAATEALIAVSLISGRGLRIMAPVGFALSFAIWSTAETFGGFYAHLIPDAPMQLFGTASVYMLAFVYVMILYNPLELLRARPAAQEDDKGVLAA